MPGWRRPQRSRPAWVWRSGCSLATAAVVVATLGAGKVSLDCALFHSTGFYDLLHGWCGLVISLALGLAGGIGQLVIFWRPPVKA